MLSLKSACFRKRRWNMRNYSFTLFTCFSFRLLWLWFAFLNSVSVLRFNFVFLCVFPVWDDYFRLGIWVFLFSGGVFLFWLSYFVYVFPFWVCSLLFWLLLLSCGFFVSIGHPIYLIVLCIQIQPLENTSKLRWKYLQRYQIVQVRNNLL